MFEYFLEWYNMRLLSLPWYFSIAAHIVLLYTLWCVSEDADRKKPLSGWTAACKFFLVYLFLEKVFSL